MHRAILPKGRFTRRFSLQFAAAAAAAIALMAAKCEKEILKSEPLQEICLQFKDANGADSVNCNLPVCAKNPLCLEPQTTPSQKQSFN